MTEPDDPVEERDLLAYVDNQLDPPRQRVVARFLGIHPEVAARVRSDEAINRGIRRLYGHLAEEVPPQRLSAMLASRPRRRRGVAVLALCLATGGLGWIAGRGLEPAPALTGQVRKPVAATPASPPQGAALAWFGTRINRTVQIPDLAALGWHLSAQIPAGTPNRPMLQLTYTDGRGQRLDLFLQARWEDQPANMAYNDAGGRGLVYWTDGQLAFALAGALPPEQLRAIAEVVQGHAQPQPQPQPQPPAAVRPVASGGGR